MIFKDETKFCTAVAKETADEESINPFLIGCLRLSCYRRMTIDVEFLLARHPLLFLGRKSRIKCLNSSCILTAIGGSRRNKHPLFAVKHVWNKLANEQCRWEVAVHNKTYVLLFAAHEAATDVVARIAEDDVHVISHLSRHLKGMLNQNLAQLLPLIFRHNAKRSKGEYLLALTVLVLKPRLRVHDVANDISAHIEDIYGLEVSDSILFTIREIQTDNLN